ncbi:unnamed protein product [Rhodiola kirilowii]
MESVTRAVNTITSIATSNAGINVFLFGVFGALSVRSLVQQRQIDALEVEKESLAIGNKEMKKTMWDWKQKLYADASDPKSAVVPLTKLKAIYGDYTAPPTSNPTKEDAKASTPKFVI